jgi:uncharacterized protein (TIGR02996 family)
VRQDLGELLTAIISAPDDDGPREVYADALLARGDVRGELIRLQLLETRNVEQGNRERELLKLHEREWAEPLTRHGGSVVWRRGFPEVLIIAGDKVLDALEPCFAAAPIRSLAVTVRASATAAALMQRHELSRVEELSFSGSEQYADWTLSDAGAQALGSSPHLGKLKKLELGPNRIGAAGLTALARAPWLRQLTYLSIYRNTLPLASLLEPLRCGQLEELRLWKCELQDADAVTLANLLDAPRLKTLALGDNRVGRLGAHQLSSCKSFGQLEVLDLDGSDIQGEGAKALAHSSTMPKLKVLRAHGNLIDDAGAVAFATSTERGALTELKLSKNLVGAVGAKALAGSAALPNLVKLELQDNQLGVEGVEAFARGAGLPALRTLGVSHNGIYTSEAVEYTDWDGTVVGGGLALESAQETRKRFTAKPHLNLL